MSESAKSSRACASGRSQCDRAELWSIDPRDLLLRVRTRTKGRSVLVSCLHVEALPACRGKHAWLAQEEAMTSHILMSWSASGRSNICKVAHNKADCRRLCDKRHMKNK